MIELHNKDCLELMQSLPDNSIDAVVTDPPYGMSQHSQQDIVAALTAWLTGEEYVHGKGGFMGKTWDSFVPSPTVWREVLRVLKPGGHILCAASSRTSDLMGISLRLGGFEIRDTIEYLYGSGFPKSLNINKKLIESGDCGTMEVIQFFDKDNNYAIERAEQNTKYNLRFVWNANLQETFNASKESGEVLQSRLSQQNPHSPMQRGESSKGNANGEEPSLERWRYIQTCEGELQRCKVCEMSERIHIDGEEGWLCNGAPISNGATYWQVVKQNGSCPSYRSCAKQQQNTESNVVQRQFRTQTLRSDYEKTIGQGSNLKPAHEPFILARKPIEKGLTISENCLKWGTGGLDIDGSRIETKEDDKSCNIMRDKRGTNHGFKDARQSIRDDVWVMPSQGRFPANVIHDGSECVLDLFPEGKSGGGRKGEIGKRNYFESKKTVVYGVRGGLGVGGEIFFDEERNDFYTLTKVHSDTGSAARFFYCAKASPSERNAGLADFEDKQVRTTYDKKVRDAHDNDSGKPRKNIHPTVKPITLMCYLVRLITPENGIVLDPFMGSGTTGIAAKNLGRGFIGCELETEYFEIAKARIEHHDNL